MQVYVALSEPKFKICARVQLIENNKGFSLIEVIVAITILVIVVGPLIVGFLVSNTNNNNSSSKLSASSYAQQKIEQLRNLERDDLENLVASGKQTEMVNQKTDMLDPNSAMICQYTVSKDSSYIDSVLDNGSLKYMMNFVQGLNSNMVVSDYDPNDLNYKCGIDPTSGVIGYTGNNYYTYIDLRLESGNITYRVYQSDSSGSIGTLICAANCGQDDLSANQSIIMTQIQYNTLISGKYLNAYVYIDPSINKAIEFDIFNDVSSPLYTSIITIYGSKQPLQIYLTNDLLNFTSGTSDVNLSLYKLSVQVQTTDPTTHKYVNSSNLVLYIYKSDVPYSEKIVSSAAAAYSLRKLRSTYTGPCLRVQNGGSGSQTDIGFGADGWLDQAALSAAVDLNKIGYVVTWYDQSGNNNNADANVNSYPYIINNGVISNAIYFSAGGNQLVTPLISCLRRGYENVPATLYVNAAIDNGNTYLTTIILGEEGCSSGILLSSGQEAYYAWYNSNADANPYGLYASFTGITEQIGSFFSIVYAYSGGTVGRTVKGYRCGNYLGNDICIPDSAYLPGYGRGFSIGNNDNPFIGYISEAMIFMKTLDANEVQELNQSSHLSVKPTDVSTTNIGSYIIQDSEAPTFAYGLRKLKSTYAGPCLNVRRSNDSQTMDIYFDAYGNIDTNALENFIGTGIGGERDGYVDAWYDQSENNNNAIQVVEDFQPKIVISGSGITRKVSINYDGVDDYLVTTNPLNFTDPTTDKTLLAICEPYDLSDRRLIGQTSTITESGSVSFYNNVSNNNALRIYQGGTYTSNLFSGFSLANNNALAIEYSSTAYWNHCWLNNYPTQVAVSFGLTCTNNLGIGSPCIQDTSTVGQYWYGNINELIIYNSAISDIYTQHLNEVSYCN